MLLLRSAHSLLLWNDDGRAHLFLIKKGPKILHAQPLGFVRLAVGFSLFGGGFGLGLV